MFVIVGEKNVFFFGLCSIIDINFPFFWFIHLGRIITEEYR